MERLVIFFAFIVLILMIEDTNGNPSCAEDNTAYYGNNLVNAKDNKKGSSTECQMACANYVGCNYWSWRKDGFGWCYLKHSKPTSHPNYGEVTPGNNMYYVSGPKQCPGVN